MRKKIITFILAFTFIASTCIFSACSLVGLGHTHIYSTEWTFDETHHWHNAECVHMTETKDKAEHVFDSGVETKATFESAGYITYGCTVCDYEKQVENEAKLEHNYSSGLTHDNGETHWYACIDAGYESLRKGEEKHALVESSYDETTGYATFTCSCGFEKKYLRSTITTLPTISSTAYVGQKLSDLALSGGLANVEGVFAWTTPDTVITASGNYNVTFTPTDSSYAPVTAVISLTATQLTVTVTVGDNGSASKEGSINVNYGESLTVTFTPNSGYTLGTLTVDQDEVVATSFYTFENITANHTLSITFSEQIDVANLPFTLTCVSGTENAYTYQDGVLTFTTVNADTVYAISGELSGNIVIDVDETGTYKFDLEMLGFTLTSDSINPITVLSGNEVSIKAKNGYENYVNDNREAIASSDTTLYSAAIYSLVDLEISGKGKLTLSSTNNNGIHSKDDLQVKNLNLSVTCVDNALKGNDGVEITGATTTLIAKKGDCIKTTNSHINQTTLKQKGTVLIAGGTHNLYAACDAIDSAYNVLIQDSTTVLNIYTDKYSEYSEEVTVVSESTYYIRYSSQDYKYSIKYFNSDTEYLWVNPEYNTSVQSNNKTYYYYSFAKNTSYSKMMLYVYSSSQAQGQTSEYVYCSESLSHNDSLDTIALSSSRGSLSCNWTSYTTSSSSGGGGGSMQEGNSDKGTYSTKGIKSANEITIDAGAIFIKAYDDAIHANNDGGTLENGETPTGNVTINGGVVTVYSNDDGVHSDGTLTINAGTVNVTNAYEGIEGGFILVKGGSVSVISSDDGFNATSETGAAIEISGGTVYVYAGGDGLDSNSTTSKGAIIFAGGDVVVICTSNGNSAIDSSGGYTQTAGRVVAIMSTGSMTSESTNGNTVGMTTKTSLSLSNGGYLTVTVSSATVVTVKMPCALTGYIVYLGSSSATISSDSSSTASLDANGVCWA